MADVFLSYSQKDRECIDRIARNLKRLGLEVWYDIRLDAGMHFDEVINAELRLAKSVLVCWSPNSIEAPWPRAEAFFAFEKKKLAAAFVARCDLTLPFNLLHTPDMSDWDGAPEHSGWLIVARILGNLCGRPGVGALAEALAMNSPDAVFAWSQAFPDEPIAQKMWASGVFPSGEEFFDD